MDKLVLSDVHKGAEVVDSDGVAMGRITEVGATHFRVLGTDGADFWISTSIAEAADDQRVTLRFEASQVRLYESPSAEADDAETARQTQDVEIPDLTAQQT
jgi:hypothetical protein